MEIELGISFFLLLALTFLAAVDMAFGQLSDVGLRRLRDEATANHATLEELLTRVVSELRDGAEDDTAIAGIRWLS